MSEFDLVKREFWDKLERGEDGACPCCNRFTKIYKRRIHHTAARGLILLYRLGGANEFIHARNLVVPGQTAPGDLTKSKHWGLVEPKPREENDDNDDRKSNGFWRLTPDGVAFVQNRKRVPKFAILYDDELLRFEGDDISIQEALGHKFSYGDLMSERVSRDAGN